MDRYRVDRDRGQASNAPTILDYLNEDCWRAVLKYVPVYDIVQSERTSKRWQEVVLGYLSHARISIVHYHGGRFKSDQLALRKRRYHFRSFKRWTYKLGSSIVAFEKGMETDDDMEILRNHCPKLEELKFSFLEGPLPPNSAEEHFPHLKNLLFEWCDHLSDKRVGEYLASPALEKLTIQGDERVTGTCLTNLKSTKFKSVVFSVCSGLKFAPLMSAADRLGGLTELVLYWIQIEMGTQVHLLIKKMPKLEYLTVYLTENPARKNFNLTEKADFFFDSVCRLEKLKHLRSDFFPWDEHVEAVTRCCKQLEVLKLQGPHVTGRGLKAVCTGVGARLVEADFSYSRVSVNDVVSLVYACPNLTQLTMSFCGLVAGELCPRVAAARREMRAKQIIHLILIHDRRGNEDDSHFYARYYPEEFCDVLKTRLPERHRHIRRIDSDGLTDSDASY